MPSRVKYAPFGAIGKPVTLVFAPYRPNSKKPSISGVIVLVTRPEKLAISCLG